MILTGTRSLRAPWPADASLADVDIPLAYADPAGTQFVTEIPQDQGAVTPQEYGESARDPVFGGIYSIRDLTRGYGQARLAGAPNGRYRYALNVDVSAGPWLKGPTVTSYTPSTRDSTNGIDRFFEIGGQILALNGRYVLDGDTDGTGWATSGQGTDFGVGNAATDVIVVQANDGSSSRYAWIGMGDSVAMYYFDGTTYTQTSGANLMYARAFCQDATNLYRFDDTNRMWQVDLLLDPRTAANWPSATDRIGSKDHGVVRATVDQNGAVIVLKADDVYTFNRTGTVNRLFQQAQFVTSTANGEALATWQNDLYVTYGNRFFRLTADGGLTQVGPELIGENDSPVKGYVSAAVGCDFFLVAGLYNPDSGNSYVVTFAGEIVEDDYKRAIPVWHGSITAAFSSKKITALHQSERGASSGHKMVYLGFSDGTIAKFQLACTKNPQNCSSYSFSTADGSLYLPRVQFYFAGEQKALFGVTGEGNNFTSSAYAQVQFKTAESASYATLTPNFATAAAQQIDFPDYTSGAFLDPLVVLVSSAATTSPAMTGLGIHWMLRTVPRGVMRAYVPTEDHQYKRDGTPYRRTGQQLREWLHYLAGAAWAVPFVDPDGVTRKVVVLTPRRTVAYHGVTRAPIEATLITLVEAATVYAEEPVP